RAAAQARLAGRRGLSALQFGARVQRTVSRARVRVRDRAALLRPLQLRPVPPRDPTADARALVARRSADPGPLLRAGPAAPLNPPGDDGPRRTPGLSRDGRSPRPGLPVDGLARRGLGHRAAGSPGALVRDEWAWSGLVGGSILTRHLKDHGTPMVLS